MRKTLASSSRRVARLSPAPRRAGQKVVLGMSGWTGFRRSELAERAGIFKKNGVDIEIRFIPPVQRSAALAAGALNAAATTVDQHIVWTSAGISDRAGGADRQVERRRRYRRARQHQRRSRS